MNDTHWLKTNSYICILMIIMMMMMTMEKENYNFLINEEKKIICYVYMYTYNNNDMSFRLSLIAKVQKIENFILFPLSWKAAKKISQCQCMYTLFIFIVKVVLYKKKRVERQKKYFFYTIDFCFRDSFYIFLPFWYFE